MLGFGAGRSFTGAAIRCVWSLLDGFIHPSGWKTRLDMRWEHLKNPFASPPHLKLCFLLVFRAVRPSLGCRNAHTSAQQTVGLGQWGQSCPMGEKTLLSPFRCSSPIPLHAASCLRRAAPSIPALDHPPFAPLLVSNMPKTCRFLSPSARLGVTARLGLFRGASPALPGCSQHPASSGKQPASQGKEGPTVSNAGSAATQGLQICSSILSLGGKKGDFFFFIIIFLYPGVKL